MHLKKHLDFKEREVFSTGLEKEQQQKVHWLHLTVLFS